MGAAEAAANLLCEFKIAEKNEAKEIKNKKGNVILVKFVANSIFSKNFYQVFFLLELLKLIF